VTDLLKQYIDGTWVDSLGGEVHQVLSPATELPVTQITLGTARDVDAAVAAARRAFGDYSRTSLGERIALLENVIQQYQMRIPDLVRAVSEEVGAPIGFCGVAQVPAGLGQIMATLGALRDFPFEESLVNGRVVHEPIGVVAMITPWNWPLNQICAKLAPALAAGNTVVLKPSEEAPSCAMILAEILHDAGVPPGVFNLVNGRGTEVGAALAEHADVDMVSFTGSTRAGIAVAVAAARTVKRVHQELGGKAPNLVLPGADLPTVLPQTLPGIFANSGQSCIAPTRLLVHRAQADVAITVIKAIAEQVQVGDPAVMGPHIGPVINATQFDKIQDLVKSAIDEGAILISGGLGRPEGFTSGFYVRPTVLARVTPAMRIWREEIFGPVATITLYDDLDEAVMLANDTIFGLSAVVSGDPVLAAATARRLRAGLVTINSWATPMGLPFGGYGQSGNGREGGRFGLGDFMEVKAIAGAPA